MEINVENARLVLEKYLGGTKKYEHSLRVAQISEILAYRWGASVEDSIVAAMLHDIGKSMSKQEMLSLCVQNNITIYDFELFENVTALHGKISALLFEKEFQGNDSNKIKEMSHAISSHVAGDIKMNLLDKIIFVADNLDEKEESIEILEQIKDNKLTPDECVEIVIKEKYKRNEKRGIIYNPLLDAANKGAEVEEYFLER